MPYIPTERRKEIIPGAGPISPEMIPGTAGELNYSLTRTLIEYMKYHNNYQGINDVLGALEGAKLEFYRRWAVPYEDFKINENGDVYPT